MNNNTTDNSKKNKDGGLSFIGMIITGIILCVMMAALYLVQTSVPYSLRNEEIALIPKSEIMEVKSSMVNIDTSDYVIIMENDDVRSMEAAEYIKTILSQMKINCFVYDTDEFSIDKVKEGGCLLIAVDNYATMSEYLGDIKNWVKNGGNLYIAFPPEPNGSFKAFSDIIGLKECGNNSLVAEVRFKKGFLIGGETRPYPIVDAFDSALEVTLEDDCEVYMETTEKYAKPLIWTHQYEKGRVVFNNFGIMEKAFRGINAASISLLEDCFAYPVINGSTFYIDDFPSPVPEGDGKYITRDYNLSISNFYSQVWWNDIYDFGKEYGIRYTGLVIEEYSDVVKGTFERNEDIERYLYFGNMLLQSGGEIGIHGYNHMPLVLQNFDYKNLYDEYVQWSDVGDIRNAVNEVIGFTKGLFPDEQIQVYVPPSNILSEEGRGVLNDSGIESIAAVYLGDDVGYEQEFDVSAEDGIVNTPRVISGYVLGDYMQLAALSELNMHLVNTHFQHPDDALDNERGAELGWKELHRRLGDYIDWLYNAAPEIRNLTGSELAGAVERYDVLQVKRTETKKGLKLEFENFYDEAYMLVRLNEDQRIGHVVGGSYIKMTDSLALIKCDEATVEIIFI